MLKRLTVETKKSLAKLLVQTAVKRVLEEKKCAECKNKILAYIKISIFFAFTLRVSRFALNYFGSNIT
jgi:hypothetical protein